MTRDWILRIGGALLLLACLVPVGWSQSAGPSEPLGTAWSRSLRGVITLTVSPDGKRVLAVDAGGTLHCYDERGALLWTQDVGSADRVVSSRGGGLILAYAERRPLARRVLFLGSDGRRLGALDLPAAIQTAVVAPDARLAAIGSGSTLVFCSPRGGGIHRRDVEIAGAVQQLQFGPADSAYVTTHDPNRLQLVKSTGRVLWQRQTPRGAECSISASADGKLLVVGSQRSPSGETIDLLLLDHRNEKRWTYSTSGRAPRVRLSTGGAAVMLAYEHRVTHGMRMRYEPGLAYFDETGSRRWAKGGIYTAPLYTALDGDGEWVVALEMQRDSAVPWFRLYGKGGERRWRYTCPAGILIATASAEGRHIAAYRADGVLEMVQVAASQD